MKWTKEKPKAPGWYWVTSKELQRNRIKPHEIVWVFWGYTPGVLMYECATGASPVAESSKGSLWSDRPIPEPQKIS